MQNRNNQPPFNRVQNSLPAAGKPRNHFPSQGRGATQSPTTDTGFKVVFWGQPAAGVRREVLAKAFAKQFRVRSLTRLRHFFTGRLVVLKEGLSESRARQLVRLVESIGGVCRMERCQSIQLQGELAERHTPSFLQADFDASQLALVQEAPEPAPVVDRRNPFEARELQGR